MKIEVSDDEYRLILNSIFQYASQLQMIHYGHTPSLMEPEKVDMRYKECCILYDKLKAFENKTE